MTALRLRAEDYLAMRRSLGFKLISQGRTLMSFVGYAEAASAETITTGLAVDWARSAGGAGKPSYWAQRLSVVRMFALHLSMLEAGHEIPPVKVLRQRTRRITPYIYSDEEIAALLQAAARLRPAFRAATWQTVLALLAVTGLRVSEACALDLADLDPVRGVLTIRSGKGGSRDIPLDPTTLAALIRYTGTRHRACPVPQSPALFLSMRGTRLDCSNMPRVFRGLLADAGVAWSPGRRRPRIHDLRHSMAVATLLRWYRQGADVHAMLPLLTSYLGHDDPKSTYYYMTATPELLALAVARLEASVEEQGAR